MEPHRPQNVLLCFTLNIRTSSKAIVKLAVPATLALLFWQAASLGQRIMRAFGASRYGLFLSVIRQGLFYIPFILTLPKLLGVKGIYFFQPSADILTVLVCVLSVKA